MVFRDLRADEIDCRVATCTENGCSLLLYKDARCDMNILDETVGSMNWQRKHTRENANCVVSIWDAEKKMWIEKEDTGTESNTEAEKGLASDSFKRACFNWGIGRELYTAPFIWVSADQCNLKQNQKTSKYQCNDKFIVESITIEDKKIVALSIKNMKTGIVCFTLGGKAPAKKAPAKKTAEKKVEEPVKEEPKKEAPKKEVKGEKFPNRNKFLIFCRDNDLDWKSICKELKLDDRSADSEFVAAHAHAVRLASKGLPFDLGDMPEEI